MIITTENRDILLPFISGEAANNLEDLAKILLEYYSKQCTMSEGHQIYRDQGAAQLAEWLLKLPKVLRNGNESSRPATAG